MQEILNSLIEGLSSSAEDFREKEEESKKISEFIENEDFENLKAFLSINIKKEEYLLQDLEREIPTIEEITNTDIRLKRLSSRSETLNDDEIFEIDKHLSKKSEINKKNFKNMEEKMIYNSDNCVDRKITKMEWNYDNQNIFMSVCDSKSGNNLKNPLGLVNLWDADSKNAPLRTLEFSNRITSISFVRNNPSLVIGGTNTGRVLVWDVRTKRKTPSTMSSPTFALIGNSDIVALKVTQSEFFSPILGILSNGRICKWKLSMLSAPEEILFEGNSKRWGNALCGDIINNVDDICVYGTHSGNIIKIDPYFEDGQKATILTNLKFPITSINFHKCQFESARLPLFLSTSLDGSLRIWNVQKCTQLLNDNKFNNSFVDTKWCPVHPSVYATSDSLGIVNFCNALKSAVPMCNFKNERQKLYTCMSWSPDGSTLLLGRTDGKISAIHIEDKYITPNKDDASKLNSFSERLTQQTEMELDRSDIDLDGAFSQRIETDNTSFSINMSIENTSTGT